MLLSGMGESISEGTVAQWLKQPGDWVDEDEAIVVMDTDKVAVELRAEFSGFIQEHLVQADDTVEVGAPIVTIVPGEKPADAGSSAPAPAPAPAAESEAAPAPASAPTPAPTPAPAPAPTPAPAPAAGSTPAPAERSEERVKMSRMRQRIAARLKDAQNTNAMLTTFQEVDMSALINLRKKYKDAFADAHGVKLGFMSAFIKASALALQEIPAVNAVVDGGDIVYRNYVDVSVAVASPRGLVVPVVRDVQDKGFADIEGTLADLASKARSDAITMEDMAGGTFTISNGGVFGSMMGTPIINPPQSAILGMHATKMRPVVVDGEITMRPVMYLALTYDHRLIDGREAVTFLCSIRDKVEDPSRMLLGL